jgi:hypothetical protein
MLLYKSSCWPLSSSSLLCFPSIIPLVPFWVLTTDTSSFCLQNLFFLICWTHVVIQNMASSYDINFSFTMFWSLELSFAVSTRVFMVQMEIHFQLWDCVAVSNYLIVYFSIYMLYLFHLTTWTTKSDRKLVELSNGQWVSLRVIESCFQYSIIDKARCSKLVEYRLWFSFSTKLANDDMKIYPDTLDEIRVINISFWIWFRLETSGLEYRLWFSFSNKIFLNLDGNISD